MTLISALKNSVFLPVLLIIIAMLSIQTGAAMAKMVFPLIGASGMTALRLAIGALILLVVFRPWRLRFGSDRLSLLVYGITLGGMNYLFYLALRTVPLGIVVALEFTGPLAVAILASRRLLDFMWVLLAAAGLWLLLPLGQHIDNVDLTGAAFAVGARLLGGLYPVRSEGWRQPRRRHRGDGFADRRADLLSGRPAFFRYQQSIFPQYSADRYSGGCAVHRVAVYAGNAGANPFTGAYVQHPDEPGTRGGGDVRHSFSRRTPVAHPVAGAGVYYYRLAGHHA